MKKQKFKRVFMTFHVIGLLIVLIGAARNPGQAQVPDKIAPEVQEVLASAGTAEILDVIVTMRTQANLSGINNANRAERVKNVIQNLQDHANQTQHSLQAWLDNKKTGGDVEVYQAFWIFNGMAVRARASVIEELAARPDIATITPNVIDIRLVSQTGSSNPEPNLAVVNAPEVWSLGYRGQGIVVASMDSGVDYTHPDLNGRWRGGTNSWYDPYGQHPGSPIDLTGHGTWTMGVMVGGDSGGTAVGMAPDAQWIAVKIFDDAGQATAAAIHAGYQWLLDPDGDPGTADSPHIVNNSWTYGSAGCNLDFEYDLQSLRAAGILPVFAAGNAGPNSGTSRSPANNPTALAVGATSDSDTIYFESSRGPSACGETETIFPEIVAPGVMIHTTDLFASYYNATGTSLAAPHVSGGAALLLSAFPDVTTSSLQDALLNSAVDLGSVGADNDYGFGRLDILASYEWLQGNPPPAPTPVPVNLALNRPVMVSSFQNGGYDGSKAVDGDLSSYWKTKRVNGNGGPATEWISIDLGGTVAITQLTLNWHDNYATSYSIDLSADNASWSTLYSTAAGNGGIDQIVLNNADGRYLRLMSTEWNNNTYRNWLREFEVYGTVGQPTPTDTPIPTSTSTPSPTTSPAPTANLHVGDLDGNSRGFGQKWRATVVVIVHDENEVPLVNTTVYGNWSGGYNGPDSCITDDEGQCSMTTGMISGGQGSVTFSVDEASQAGYTYDPAENHDPDGDSDGTIITVFAP